MKIARIGSGAMGSLYGGYLSKAGNEVYLVDIWKEHIENINNQGLKILEKDDVVNVTPKGVIDSKEVGKVDLAVVFVKSIATQKALESNSSIFGDDTMVLSLQNGYGNVEDIEKFVKADNIIAGTTSHGATLLGPGKIKHAGKGKTIIGKAKGETDDRVNKIKEMLEDAGFETEVSDNVMELIWSKLLVNIGINALTAVLEIENGRLTEWEESEDLVALAVREAVKVANNSGLQFNDEEEIEHVLEIAKATAENKSSMYQDILNKRKTEIEKINGAVVKIGKEIGIETPVNETLTNLVKIKEKL
jgi:2-dehydropantoate 2-reductase